MNACLKCGKFKPLTEFYSSNKSSCKDCVKLAVRKNRTEKVDYYREYDRKRSNNPERVFSRAAYSATEKGKAVASKAKQRYADKDKQRKAAHYLLANAVRDGRIRRLACEVCGADKTEAHHPDYRMPLVVTWLCGKHHKQLHKEFRAYLRTNNLQP